MTKLENELRKLREEQPEAVADFVENDYIRELKRVGASNEGTQANYLQAVRKILQFTDDLDILKLDELQSDELKDLNKTVADNIQDSVYRFTNGENSQRRKTNQWTAWKRILETQGINTSNSQNYMPEVRFTSNGKVNKQADTKPSDLPTPKEMRRFVEELGRNNRASAKRNQAFAMLLWDKGPRIGEALSIRIGDIKDVGDNFIELRIPGNKGSDSRTVKMFQGVKIMKDWLEQHPEPETDDAFLFCNVHHGNAFNELGKSGLKKAWQQAHHDADVSFKLKGEPFHIFRKAMVTYHVVNDYASWEEICTWQGKSVSGTKPDYLKMAVSDVDESVAGRMGVELNNTGKDGGGHRMLGEPLTPMKCTGVNCGRLNSCVESTCRFCGRHLPDSTLPQADEQEKSDSVNRNLAARIAEELAENPDKTLNEIAEDMKDDG